MRRATTQVLREIAGIDSRVVLLTGDLGYTVLEPYIDEFPNRFFNMGVAEQNMVGVATGLAEAGFVPFVYSINTFAALRPYEFIRNGPILHQLPVRILAIGGGFEYGGAGTTHHGLEDIGVMRVQPGITVIAPADASQARTALLSTWDLPGPVYYRLGKNDNLSVPGLDGRFRLGELELVEDGTSVLLLSMGSIGAEVAQAAADLRRQGVDAAFAVVASLNPPPELALRDLLSRFPLAVTVEAHYVNGGLGSLVSEVVAEHGVACRVIRCGVRRISDGRTGSETSLNRLHGIDHVSISTIVQTILRG